MDDFDWGDWLGEISSGLDIKAGSDTSWLDDFDWSGALNNLDFSGLDLSNVIGDIGAGGLDALVGNFAEDVESQAGGFYGNAFGKAEYDPRTDTTEIYDPKTDTIRTIVHGGGITGGDYIPGFDESEFTRSGLFDDEGAGTVEIVGQKPTDEVEDELANDYWRNLLTKGSTTNIADILTDEEHTRQFEDDGAGTIEIVGKKPTEDSILTDEEHTRTDVDTDKDPTSILTDEEHVRKDVDVKDDGDKKTTTTTPPKKTTPTNNKTFEQLMALLGGLVGLMGNKPRPVGYQGGIPRYMATRGTPRSPTAGGRRPGAAGLGSLTGGITYTPVGAAGGGLMGLAEGGKARPARYLRGGTDGMADKIQTDIDGKQPARLSHGEFVIPADVVSHLGNGNSDAGADVLYDMMAKVRKARTGTTKQGKQINPRKYTPA